MHIVTLILFHCISTDQNRNSKPGSVPGKPPSGGLGSKRSQQPSNQLVSAAHREEVTRLEALCESRTKELNYARMQFKQSVAGFEAMSVLVKYLTEEVRGSDKAKHVEYCV